MNISGPLDREILRVLREIPSLTVESETTAGGRRCDFVLQAGAVTTVIELKALRAVNAADAQRLIAHHRPEATNLVLAALSITDDARDRLTSAGIGVIDGTGAIRLDLPGLYVWRDGWLRPRVTSMHEARGVRLAGKAGVAAQALLHHPERHWTIHELADEAGVSTGLAHRLFVRLEQEAVVQADGSGPRKTRTIVDAPALLNLWAEEMTDRGVRQVKAYRLARDPLAQAASLSRALVKAGIDHAVTGAAAAARLAPFVTAVPVTTVWVSELADLERAALATGAHEATDGHNVVFCSARDDAPLAFRAQRDGTWIADVFRVFLDLRTDPRRGREQADEIRKEIIGF